MRVARVKLNETCNQNCGFCNARRPSEARELVEPASVRARIAQTTREAPEELVLTGGEPTLRRDLERWVEQARASSQSVTLETNGALLDEARIDALERAGVTTFRVHLPAWGETCDAITRDPGGFERTLAALRTLTARKARFELAVPLVTQNEHAVGELPATLARAELRPRAILVSVLSDAPDHASLLTPERAARAFETLAERAREHELPLSIDAASPLPPCLLQQPDRHAHRFALTPGGARRPGFRRVTSCEPCQVADRCPGLPEAWLARHTAIAPRPILEDRLRRRLTVITSTEAQVAEELVTREVRRFRDGSVAPVHVVRVIFQCNQSCEFCFVSTHLPRPSDADVERAIRDAGREHAILELSGGEPTLSPRLVEWVRLGHAVGVRAVELQTNAVRLEDQALCGELVDAGVSAVLVSLHASHAALSERITRAPGTFERTLRGLDELGRHRVALRLNFVLCGANAADFPATVRLIAERWPDAELTVSMAGAFTDLVPQSRAVIPRFSDVLGPLREGLDRARDAGLRVVGFDAMCGMPFCLAPLAGGAEAFFGLSQLTPELRGNEFVQGSACAECVVADRCYGVRRSYAELYGTDELRAVRSGVELRAPGASPGKAPRRSG